MYICFYNSYFTAYGWSMSACFAALFLVWRIICPVMLKQLRVLQPLLKRSFRVCFFSGTYANSLTFSLPHMVNKKICIFLCWY